MESFRVDPDSIEAWARFSGDRNPIHFDRKIASRLGTPDVVAHGRLVLLIIMDTLSRAAFAHGWRDGWWSFRSRMRHPIVAGHEIRLSSRPDGSGIAFHVESPAGQRLLTGSLDRDAGHADRLAPAAEVLPLEADLIVAEVARLKEYFGWIDERWVMIDAIAFAQYLRGRLRGYLLHRGESLGPSPGDSGGFAVQTSHNVDFDGGTLDGLNLHDIRIDMEMMPPESVSIPGGILVECGVVLRLDGKVIMRSYGDLFVARARDPDAAGL